MSTTSLFVELVVIGSGVFVWAMLLAGSVIGFAWLPEDHAILVGSAVPALSLVYVFGIVWDRIADWIFDKVWSKKLKSSFFPDEDSYLRAKRLSMTQAQPVVELFEYGRSRLRICRGWALNAIMIGFAGNCYLWRQPEEADWPLLFLCTFGSLSLAAGCWFAWRGLVRMEYRKLGEQLS